MPLTYPLAETARAALDTETTARTVGEARDIAGGAVSLVSEWLRPSASERQTLQPRIDAGVTAGFIQVYEDNQGQPVFAVAFWKRGVAPPAPPLPHRETVVDAAAAQPAASDTVDDLYFERGRTSRRARRGRMRQTDPNQMDLFAGPSQKALAATKGDPAAEPAGASPPKSAKPKAGRRPKA